VSEANWMRFSGNAKRSPLPAVWAPSPRGWRVSTCGACSVSPVERYAAQLLPYVAEEPHSYNAEIHAQRLAGPFEWRMRASFELGWRECWYRVISSIHFNRQMLFVRHVFTHKEYDKWKS
jgi:hypothetical protein